MKYSIARRGEILGSYSLEEIQASVQSGKILATDHALPPSATAWISVGQLLGSPSAGGASVPVPPPPPPVLPPKPSNHLVQSILVTLLCCLPFGIVAIVYSSQVDTRYAQGDYEGAKKSSANANKYAQISFGIGLFVVIIYIIGVAMGSAVKR